jgi:acyl-coenzyme A synthetase/AMP-(fatty) acid ligase
MLFPTPRYGAESIARLVASVDGSVMLVPSESSPVVSEVLAKRPMRRFDFPSVDHLIASTPTPYKWTKTFESHKLEPLVCLHTSGTTGFPKPIIWTHDWANSVVRGDRLPAPAGYERPEMVMQGPRTRTMHLFPPMHASGIITALFFQLGCGSVIVHAPIRMMPNEAVDVAVDALEALGDAGKVDLFGLPPPQAEYLAANKPLLERVGRVVETVLWAGGSISDAAGKALSARVQTFTPLASTEMGLWSSVRKLAHGSTKVVEDEYQYNSFHPSLNIRFDEASKDDRGTLYEAVIVKNQGEGAWVQPLFKIFTEVQEKSLGDLFTQHPHDLTKWKHAGRSDDLLVFIDTMKFHPGFAERQITAHPGVAEAIIAGTRRSKASIIVRLNNGAEIEEVQKLVEDVTKDYPFYARIDRSMVLTVTEPFPKTAKGSIQKQATLGAYEKQLDALYKNSVQGVETK